MESVHDLIQELAAQERAGASVETLIGLTARIYDILQPEVPASPKSSGSKVAVLMPVRPWTDPRPRPDSTRSALNTLPETPATTTGAEAPVVAEAPMTDEVPFKEEALAQIQNAVAEVDNDSLVASTSVEGILEQNPAAGEAPATQPYSIKPPIVAQSEAGRLPVDILNEVPTMAQQPHVAATTIASPVRELFELHDAGASLNDSLKKEEKELAHKLTDTPIKDLRKGIGINDRFVFLSELFRGDETMYERSIKTINSFNILPEAEYWMARELALKLAWDNGSVTVQYFYSLVRRRFS